MGKRTEKYIAELGKLLESTAAPALQMQVFNKQFGLIRQKLIRLTQMHDQRSKEIDPGGTTQHEEEIQRDPQIKKIEAAMDILNNELMKLRPTREKYATALRKQAIAIDKKNEEFRQFLLKKNKSKNPFRSKKSLPSAVAYLKQVELFVDEFQAMLKV